MRWLPPILLLALLSACTTTPPADGFVHVPLRGVHATLTCSGCHDHDLHAALPTTCIGCHVDDAPVPHHPGDCGDCHGEEGWGLDSIDHSFFPLTLGHDGPACVDCHGDAPWEDASPACTSCHTAPAAHFPGACDDCHDLSGWEGADFNHNPFFPTPHEGVSACASCHPANDYSTFTCTDCHAHRQSRMDDEHEGETNNYVYSSPACLDCHPDGDD